ncbi:MAG: CoA transferase [Acidimicrobiia bacterium]|nr:CoA transferase [Acidimicrobiia bacterium]
MSAVAGGRAPRPAPGLPLGTVDVLVGHATRAAASLRRLGGAAVDLDEDALYTHLYLPLALAARCATAPAVGVSAPEPVGAGYVCADVVEDDRALLDALRRAHPDADPSGFAAIAQEFRLPVTPYETRPAPPRSPPADAASGAGSPTGPPRHDFAAVGAATGRRAPLDGVVVVDHCTMWAGPLCSRLLAFAGAEVVTVEPAARRDGLRDAPDGGAMFRVLAGGKQRVELDLRAPDDRGTYDDLVRRADVRLAAFSPRVAPNLGIDAGALADLNPAIVCVDIPAFGPRWGARANWLAYGGGVHAALGLGRPSGGPARTPAVSYPDPLAGFAAFAAVLAALERRGTGRGPSTVTASLADATAPLLDWPPADWSPDDDEVRALAARLAPASDPPANPFLVGSPTIASNGRA